MLLFAKDERRGGVRTLGEFRAPLIPCQMPPPTAPMAKAPPKSLRITQGLYMRGQRICHERENTSARTRDPWYDLHVPWEWVF
jgi:hypothetical protein